MLPNSLILPLAVVARLVLFAQTPILDPGIGSLIGNIGIVGILVWHLWYHTTHSYPKMLDKFSEEVEKIRVSFQREQQEQRNHDQAQREADRSHDEKEKSELRSMLIQNLQAMRTAVHDVRDTAQAAVIKAAAQTAQDRPKG